MQPEGGSSTGILSMSAATECIAKEGLLCGNAIESMGICEAEVLGVWRCMQRRAVQVGH